MQGVLSNGMVSKLLLKYMQGKGGLRTKMVLPRNKMQVYISPKTRACLMQQCILVTANFRITICFFGRFPLIGPNNGRGQGEHLAAYSCTSNWA